MVICTSDAATNNAIDARSRKCGERLHCGGLEQRGVDRVQLPEDEREAQDAGGDVNALRHLIEPHRPRREHHPRQRVLEKWL